MTSEQQISFRTSIQEENDMIDKHGVSATFFFFYPSSLPLSVFIFLYLPHLSCVSKLRRKIGICLQHTQIPTAVEVGGWGEGSNKMKSEEKKETGSIAFGLGLA